MLLGTRERESLSYVAESLAELCPAIMWKSEVVSGELHQLAEEISKQNVESAVWFLFSPLVKCERKKDRLREELLSQKDDLGNSQPIQIVKDTPNRRLTLRKAALERKPRM